MEKKGNQAFKLKDVFIELCIIINNSQAKLQKKIIYAMDTSN